jgi:pentatricopeptide repeat protein
MEEKNVAITHRTFSTILDTCAKLDTPLMVTKYFELMQAKGFRVTVVRYYS